MATGLRKSYGDKVVLDGIDLHVAEGTVFALLGPNGAAKTTVVQILSTYDRSPARQAARRPRLYRRNIHEGPGRTAITRSLEGSLDRCSMLATSFLAAHTNA